MACANWFLTIAAVVILVLALWPELLGAVATKWVVIIAAFVVLIVVWAGVKCKWCEMEKAKKK